MVSYTSKVRFCRSSILIGDICTLQFLNVNVESVCLTGHSVCPELVVVHVAKCNEGYEGYDVRSVEDLQENANSVTS